MKLSTKICLSMGLLTALMAILTIYLLLQMDKVNDASTELADKKIPIINLASQVNYNIAAARIIEVRHVYATDAGVMKANEKEIQDLRDNIAADL